MKKLSLIMALILTVTALPFFSFGTLAADSEDVAAIGDKTYASLPAAFAAAKQGDTIKLLKDIDVTTTGTEGRIKCFGGGIDLTLDGNGKTITGIADTTLAIHYDSTKASDNGGALNLTIKNLTVGNKLNIATESATALQVNTSTNVTLVDTTVTADANKWAAVVVQSSGTLTLAKGSKVSCPSGKAILLNGAAATANIYDGTVEAKNILYSRNAATYMNICQGATVIAEDGVISSESSGGTTLNVLGGSIRSNDSNSGVFTIANNATFKINIFGGRIEGGSRIVTNTGNRKNNIAYPEGQTFVDYNMSISKAENIRFASNSSGLRFETTIPANLVAIAEAAKDEGTDLEFGTLITPAENLNATNGIMDASILGTADIEGTKYLRINAENGKVDNPDGSVTIRASLVNIKPENYEKAFAAAGYITLIVDEERLYIYSDMTSQSAKSSAYKALADISAEANEEYTYAVSSYYKAEGESYTLTEASAYSKYPSARRKILENYVNGVLNHDPSMSSGGEAPLTELSKEVLSNTGSIFRTLGRTYSRNNGLACDFACTGIEFTAYCEGEIYLHINATAQAYLTVYIDGERFEERISVTPAKPWVRVAYNIPRGEHTIMIVNQSQFNMATLVLNQIKISGEFKDKPADRELFIEFYGDSILNGSNVFLGGTSAKTSDATYGFGWIAAQHLGADASIMGHGGLGLVASKNSYNMVDLYDLCGSAKLSGVPKYDFARIPDAVVIELGVNDYVNGGLASDPDTYAAGVKKFIGDLRAKYGEDTPIVWLYGYRDDEKDFWATTKEALDSIKAAGDDNIHYCKVSKAYLTKAEGGDGYHPNEKMAQTFGKEVADFLKELLK